MKKENKTKQLNWYWHIHHDILLEPLFEPLKNRIKCIRENKPKDEIELRLKLIKPVKGKLPKELVEAWQKYIEVWQKYDEAWQKYDEAKQKYDEAKQKYDEAWQKYDEAWQKHNEAKQKYIEAWQKHVEAWQKYDEAWQKYDEAWQKHDEARQKYDEARQKYLPQLKALHEKECGCGYDFKRQTIFTKENGLEK